MKRRETEYVIDRLQAEIQHYKDIANAYEREYKTLQNESKFGAGVTFILGIALGAAVRSLIP